MQVTGRARAWDWLIGALGMLLLLLIGVAVLWFAVSTPAGSGAGEPGSTDPADGPAAGAPADLSEDEVWFGDLVLDSASAVAAGSDLRDVRAVGRDVVSGPGGLVAQQLTVDATVPFDVVAEELGGGARIRAAEDGQATVERSVEALGRDLPVTATGTVEVQGGTLVVEPTSIDVGGPGFLSDGIAAVVRRFVTIEHRIEGLPEGLELQDVTVQEDGFRATLTGQDVTLGQ